MSEARKLNFFPISIFGSIMGLSGLTLSLHKGIGVFSLPSELFIVSAFVTAALFFLITFTYLVKLIKYPAAVVNEINHPIALNFFPAFSISLLLLSLIFKDLAFTAAQYMWWLGAVVHFSLLIYILNNWINQEKWQITHMTPAWFIPVVGNIVVPIGAVDFANHEIGWFFFSIGLTFWIILFSIVMYRLFFHPPMMKVLEPTLFILIAPPAVGFISYMTLTDMQGVDQVARILYYVGLFMTILLLSQSARFLKLPFALSWWAYTFPLAAMTLASMTMFVQLELMLFKYLAGFILSILSLMILYLTFKTLMAIKNKKLCMPPHAPEPEKAS